VKLSSLERGVADKGSSASERGRGRRSSIEHAARAAAAIGVRCLSVGTGASPRWERHLGGSVT
jgi:hypothetical protein